MELEREDNINILNELNLFLKLEFIDLIHISSPGSSGSRVYLFKSRIHEKLYALKYVKNNRISLKEEEKRHDLLQKYLPKHIPSVIYNTVVNDYQIMISECPGTNNLYNEILYGMRPHTTLQSIWNDVLESIGDMWITSKRECFLEEKNPRNFDSRFERIKNGLLNYKFQNDFILRDYQHLTIQVNGMDYCSINELFSYLQHINYPDFSVFCHGDPQPTNIILSKNSQWYLVDWEWTGCGHDWRMMFAHLYGWWGTRLVYLQDTPTIRIYKDRIIIDFEEYVPDYISDYQKYTFRLFDKMSNKKSRREDIKNINKYLSLLYLGDIRFLQIWERDDYALQLLAKAISVINLNNKTQKGKDVYYILQ